MGDRWRLWEVFLEEGPACGRLVLAGLVLALFAVGFAIRAAPRTRTWWGHLATLGPAVLLTSASLVSVASIVDEARDRHLAELLTTSAWFRSPWPAGAEHAWLGVLVVFLALAVPGVLWAIARTARSGRALTTAATLVTALAGIGSAMALTEFELEMFHPAPLAEREDLFILAAQASENLDWLITFVVITAVAGCFGVLLVRHRARRPPFGRRALAGAAVVFTLGALAFTGTRGHAHDRHHLIRLVHDGVSRTKALAPAWAVGSCQASRFPWTLTLEVDKSGTRASLDGRPLDLDTLAHDLRVAKREWAVLHPFERFSGALLVRLPLSAPMSSVLPWLRVAAQAGYDRPELDIVQERWVTARVAGAMALRDRCVVDVALDVDRDDLPETVEGLLREPVRSRRVR